MEVSDFDPQIVWFDDALDKDFCKKVIKKFNKDERKLDGVTASGYDPGVKQSIDLLISELKDWKTEDDVFFKSLASGLQEYSNYLQEEFGIYCPLDMDTGYQIQKTKPGGFYAWHNDFAANSSWNWRTVTYIWYLNTPREGHTEFSCGESIKPETGKLVLFPSTWDRVHRGTPPKTIKYLCTGWMFSNQPPPEEEQPPEEEEQPEE